MNVVLQVTYLIKYWQQNEEVPSIICPFQYSMKRLIISLDLFKLSLSPHTCQILKEWDNIGFKSERPGPEALEDLTIRCLLGMGSTTYTVKMCYILR